MIYDISYKTLRIRFDKIDGSIRVYDGTRYLVLFGPENYDAITIELDILHVKKVVSHMLFLTMLEKSKLILMILYP